MIVARRAAAPSGGDLHHQLGDVAEALLEGRPVLEVGALAGPLPEPHPRCTPRALGDRLAEGLDVVQPGRQQERQRRADQEVVDVAVQLRVQPHQLAVVEHRAALRLEHAGRAGVDDDQPGLGVEVAGVAPPVGLGALVGPVGERVERVAQVELAGSVVRPDLLPQLVGATLLEGRGCRGAGGPSTTPGRRRSGRATSRWPPSRGARSSWCSSRRGCRGRRRSSRSAPSRAASGSRARTRRAGRGVRTPRSPSARTTVPARDRAAAR